VDRKPLLLYTREAVLARHLAPGGVLFSGGAASFDQKEKILGIDRFYGPVDWAACPAPSSRAPCTATPPRSPPAVRATIGSSG
jgi:hypothetical protein